MMIEVGQAGPKNAQILEQEATVRQMSKTNASQKLERKRRHALIGFCVIFN
jgi:hypothetical protein